MPTYCIRHTHTWPNSPESEEWITVIPLPSKLLLVDWFFIHRLLNVAGHRYTHTWASKRVRAFAWIRNELKMEWIIVPLIGTSFMRPIEWPKNTFHFIVFDPFYCDSYVQYRRIIFLSNRNDIDKCVSVQESQVISKFLGINRISIFPFSLEPTDETKVCWRLIHFALFHCCRHRKYRVRLLFACA